MSSETPKRYIRFQKPVVIQHYILMLSVLGLMFSGYMLYSIKSAETGFDPTDYFSYSLWEQIHIWLGILLGLTILWHFLYILFTLYGHSDFLHILPNKNDLKSLIGLGFKRSMIKKERFGLQEKLTYWIIGVYLILMVITGLLQYANVYTVNYISRSLYIYIDGFHGMYGFLMGVILTVWHLYSIFLKPGRFPGTLSWWDGKISSEEMNRYQEAGGEITDESDTGKESPS